MKSTTEQIFRKEVLSALEDVFEAWLVKGYITYSFYGGLVNHTGVSRPTFFIFTDGKIKGLYEAKNFLNRKMESIGFLLESSYGMTENKVWLLGNTVRIISFCSLQYWLPRTVDISNVSCIIREKLLGLNLDKDRTKVLTDFIGRHQRPIMTRKLKDIQYF